MTLKIANNVTELIGNTPLVKLGRLAAGIDGTIALKLEFFNPAHSVKDRIAAAMIAAQHGASILRVHDVAETRDALAILLAAGA